MEIVDDLLTGADAINLAVPGYTSFQGLQTLRRAGPTLRPAVVVVAFGFNDRRYVTEASQADSAAEFERRWRHAGRRRLDSGRHL